MNSYRRGLRNCFLFKPKLFILEKVNLGPHTNCWSNLVKRFKNLYYLVRVVTQCPLFPRVKVCASSVGENTVPTCLGEQALQPTPQGAKRKKRKNGKKGEKVGLEKPADMGLEGFVDWVNPTF